MSDGHMVWQDKSESGEIQTPSQFAPQAICQMLGGGVEVGLEKKTKMSHSVQELL